MRRSHRFPVCLRRSFLPRSAPPRSLPLSQFLLASFTALSAAPPADQDLLTALAQGQIQTNKNFEMTAEQLGKLTDNVGTLTVNVRTLNGTVDKHGRQLHDLDVRTGDCMDCVDDLNDQFRGLERKIQTERKKRKALELEVRSLRKAPQEDDEEVEQNPMALFAEDYHEKDEAAPDLVDDAPVAQEQKKTGWGLSALYRKAFG